jgi:hypothetical protein
MHQGAAMKRAHPRPVRRRPAVLLTATLLALTACATATESPGVEEGRRPCPIDQKSPRTATADGMLSTPARLLAMADTITAVPADRRSPAAYPFSAVHTQHWSITGDIVEARDVVTWRSADGTARTRTLQPRRDPTRFPDLAERQRLATAPAETVDYPQADGSLLDGVITEPVPHDARTLADALYAQQRTRCRPHLLFDRYLRLAGGFYLDHQARAATLRLLATIPGLTYDGIARDLAGRTGWAFTLTRTDQHTTDTIVLNPTTGALQAAASTEINASHPLRNTLYLDRDRTTTRDQPPSP